MSLNDQFKNAKKNAQDLNSTIGETQDSFRDMRSLLEGINEELGKKINNVKEASKGYTDLTSVASKLALQEEEITRYSDAQLKGFSEKAQAARKEIEERAKALIQEKGINEELKGNEAMLNQILGFRQDLTDEQQALLRGYATEFKLEDEILDKVQKEVQIREEVNNALGVAGGIMKGLNEIGGSFAKAFKLDKVAKDMEEFAEKTIRAEGSVSRLAVLGKGLGSAISNGLKTLTDPSVIITSAIKGFKEVDKANVEFQRQTGQSLNNFGTVADSANTHFITLSDYIKTASELTKELGQNAAAMFKPEDILEASEMVHAMGMANNEAAQLSKLSKINGGNIKAQNEAIVEGVNASNRQNQTAVAAGQILKDVAKVSDGIAIIYAGYPDKLGEAATAAAALGMNLGDVDKIADSLLNFEQSIANELEAELLTGKELNLEKARQAALNNDLETVAKELANQGMNATDFAKMNRVEQERYAKALGMSKDQMAKMLILEQAKTDIGREALTDAQKQTLEQLKQEEAGEKFNKSIEKIQQALAPVVGFFANILTSVLGFLTYTKLIYPILGVIALSYVGKMVKGFKTMRDDMKSMVKDSISLAKNLFGKGDKAKEVTKDAQGRFRDAKGRFAKAPKGADKAGEAIGKSADKTKDVKGSKGKEIKEYLQGLGKGLTEIGKNAVDVMKGGLALLVATPGLVGLALASPGLALLGMVPGKGVEMALKGLARGIAFIGKKPAEILKGAAVLGAVGLVLGGSFALAMMMIKDVSPGQMIAFAGSLTMLGITMALLGNLGANILLGAAAMAVLAISLIPAAFAFSLLAGVDVGSMIAFSIALPLLALAAAGLGFLAPFIIYGSVALAALGLALIPAAEAFSNLQGVDSKALSSFSEGVYDLAWSVAGLGFLAPAIVLGGVAMAALGLALIPLSKGFAALAAVNIEGALEGFIELASIAPGLTATAAALFAVAGGMAAVAVAGYLAVPAMALMSLFSGFGDSGESKKEDEMVKMNEKLDRLIAVVEAGGDVYIDGAKVGKTLQLASSKMG